MTILKITIIGSLLAFFSCTLTENITIEEKLKAECQLKSKDRSGIDNNYVVKNTSVENLEGVKLAMGKYNEIAEYYVDVEYSINDTTAGNCSCLFDKNGTFLSTMDEIDY